MPFVSKIEFEILQTRSKVFDKLHSEFLRHNDFVLEHEGTFASMNSNSNFAELKSKRNLMLSICAMYLSIL